MMFVCRRIGLETGGKPVAIFNRKDAEDMGIRGLSRVKITYREKCVTAIVNLSEKMIPVGCVGISEEVVKKLKIKDGVKVNVEVAKFPSSLEYIKKKIKGRKLSYEEIFEIVKDVVEGNLTDMEIASFVIALETRGLDIEEAANMSLAMVETGEKLELRKKKIVDKHSIGGAIGDKTSLVAVPIIAAAGLTIPKTSSRAITSAAGTADRAEVLMPVELDVEEMREVVEKTNGCLIWGGALHLAPADDVFIQVEYPLSIDPLLLPSIMAKKKAVGSKFLVIDIPTGRGTKVKTIGDATLLAKDFMMIGKKLGMKVECAITEGENPIGRSIGPALEAKEALEVIMNRQNVPELVDKACHLAGILMEMVGMKNGYKKALRILKKGKAEKKLREIIEAQGGDPQILPEDIKIGKYWTDFVADRNGYILWMNGPNLVRIARAAGAPKYKGSGVLLFKKVGDRVKKGEPIFRVFSEHSRKLRDVKKLFEEELIVGIGDRREMLISHVKEEVEHKKTFILER